MLLSKIAVIDLKLPVRFGCSSRKKGTANEYRENEFCKCVHRYQGNYKVQSFSCLDQFLVMAFAQLTYRESLRDIEACPRAMRPKLYHMGIRGNISRNNLAHTNETRDWR